MTVDINELLDRGERHARLILVERREKSLSPMFHLVSPDGAHDAIVSVSWGSEVEKQIVLLKVRKLAEEIGAVASLSISEAWTCKSSATSRAAGSSASCCLPKAATGPWAGSSTCCPAHPVDRQ
jgi:hypothetical protein